MSVIPGKQALEGRIRMNVFSSRSDAALSGNKEARKILILVTDDHQRPVNKQNCGIKADLQRGGLRLPSNTTNIA